MIGWFKPKSAAAYAGIGERTLRTWLKEEGLRSSKVRGTVLIKQQWLDEFLEAHEQTNGDDQISQVVNEVIADLI